MNDDILANGRRFEFWAECTNYTRTYHVNPRHPRSSDKNPGTAELPLKTIQGAVDLAQPGEKVLIHEGFYREWIRPPRGGTGPDRMIAYEAGAGERVVVSGSETWHPKARPSRGWNLGNPSAPIWMADLPADIFKGYNPFQVRNAYEHLYCYGDHKNVPWMQRAMMRRGMVFHGSQRLKQVYFAWDLAQQDGSFWVEEPGLRIHFRLPGDVDPEGVELEISAREQIFAPTEFGLGYIRVSGLTLEHAADGIPIPQRAALSTTRGHHWIIEDNKIQWANGCGLDIGLQSWNAVPIDPCGHHIVRRNHISHCGICGIAGARGVEHTLIEDNLLEHIGFHDMERLYECAAIKFHFAKHTLMRRNVIRHLRHAGGIWLDVDNENNRITGSVFADIATITGGVYSEMNFESNLIDHNIFWDIRSEDFPPAGSPVPVWGGALRADCNETLIVAHNLFGKVQAHTIAFSLFQSERAGGTGRTGVCRSNIAVNNVFIGCPHRIHLGRREENMCDGNLYDRADHAMSFEIAFPAPPCRQDLPGVQRYFGLDLHSVECELKVEFDPETLQLAWRQSDGIAPERQALSIPITDSVPGPRQLDLKAALHAGPSPA